MLFSDDVLLIEAAVDDSVRWASGSDVTMQYLISGYKGATARVPQGVWQDAHLEPRHDEPPQWCFTLPGGRMCVVARVKRTTSVSPSSAPLTFLVRGEAVTVASNNRDVCA
jgi:hypothetical protein